MSIESMIQDFKDNAEQTERELTRLQEENVLWFETAKRLMPYVQHRVGCSIVPCDCGCVALMKELLVKVQAAAAADDQEARPIP